jgi:hypothetical protein
MRRAPRSFVDPTVGRVPGWAESVRRTASVDPPMAHRDEAVTAGETDVSSAAARRCYAGEDVVASSPLGAGWAAVTTHRVLAYNPTTDGRRFEAVPRPNVAGIAVDARGDDRLLGWGLRALLYGAAAVGGGVALRAMGLARTLSVGGTVDGGGGVAPVGSVLSVIDLLLAALSTLTSVLLVVGVALGLAGLVLLSRYVLSRRTTFVIERYGDDPVRLAAPRRDGERAVRALGDALTD